MTIGLSDDLGPLGTFPILQDIYLKGGMRSVADDTARDAIDTTSRKAGMLVWSVATTTLYQLGPGLGNGDWIVASFGGGSSSDFIYDSGASESGNVYASAANLMAAIAAATGLVRVQLVTNLTVTSGAHDLSKTSFYSVDKVYRSLSLSGTTTLTGLPQALFNIEFLLETGSTVYTVTGSEYIQLFLDSGIYDNSSGSDIVVDTGAELTIYLHDISYLTADSAWLDVKGTLNVVANDRSEIDASSFLSTGIELSGVGDNWIRNPTFQLSDAAGLWVSDYTGRYVKITGSTTPANDGVWLVIGNTAFVLSLDKTVGPNEAFTGTWEFNFGTLNVHLNDAATFVESVVTYSGSRNYFYNNSSKSVFINSSTTLSPGNQTVYVDTNTASAPVTVRLPKVGPGGRITIKDGGSAYVYPIVVNRPPYSQVVLHNSFESATFEFNGTNGWTAISQFQPNLLNFSTNFGIYGGSADDDTNGPNFETFSGDGGYGLTASGGNGGYIYFGSGYGGDADSGFSPGPGGDFTIKLGDGGYGTDTGSAVGGKFTLTTGVGSTAGSTEAGGNGGFISINSGDGGNGGSAGVSGDGGIITVTLGHPGSDGGGGQGIDGWIEIKAGVNALVAPSVRFYDLDNSHYAGLAANDTTTASVTYKLPPADGTTGQVLSTNGSGVLSWAAAGGGGGGLGDTTIDATLSTGVSYPSFTTIHTFDTTIGGELIISYDVMLSCGDANGNNAIFKVIALFRSNSGSPVERDVTFVNGPYKEDASMDIQFAISGDNILLQVISPSAISAWRATGYISVVEGLFA